MSRETRPFGTTGERETDGAREDAGGSARHPEPEQTIDELLDDASWIKEPGAADFAGERFEEVVARADDEPAEDLLPPEVLFPDAYDDLDEDDGALQHRETRKRRFG